MAGVETASYVGQLNQANPSAEDFVSQGDDHLRLIKETLQNTFPGFSRPIDGDLIPWANDPLAITIYAKFMHVDGRLGVIEGWMTDPSYGAFLRANNNLADVADADAARANIGAVSPNDTYLKANNLGDVDDVEEARYNLGVPSKGEVLLSTNNLSDVPNKNIARTNLDVLPSGQVLRKSENLADLPNKAVARANLNVPQNGTVLQVSANLADVASTALARNNLGVMSAAETLAAISAATGGDAVVEIQPGTPNVSIDATDPRRPVISVADSPPTPIDLRSTEGPATFDILDFPGNAGTIIGDALSVDVESSPSTQLTAAGVVTGEYTGKRFLTFTLNAPTTDADAWFANVGVLTAPEDSRVAVSFNYIGGGLRVEKGVSLEAQDASFVSGDSGVFAFDFDAGTATVFTENEAGGMAVTGIDFSGAILLTGSIVGANPSAGFSIQGDLTIDVSGDVPGWFVEPEGWEEYAPFEKTTPASLPPDTEIGQVFYVTHEGEFLGKHYPGPDENGNYSGFQVVSLEPVEVIPNVLDPTSGLPLPWDLTPIAADIYPVLAHGVIEESLPNSGIIDGDELVLPFSGETGIRTAVAYYAADLRTSEPLQAAVWRPKPDTYSVAPNMLVNGVLMVDRETNTGVAQVIYAPGAGLLVLDADTPVYADAAFDPAAGNIVIFYFTEGSPSTITISTSSGGITDQEIWSGNSLSEVSLLSTIQASVSSPTSGECRAVIDTNFSSLDGLTLWPGAVALEQMVTSLPEDAKNGDVLVVEVPGEYEGEQYGINNAGMPDGAVVIDKAEGIVLPLRNSRYYGTDNPPPRRSLNLTAFGGVGDDSELGITAASDGWYIQDSVAYPLENINFTVSGVSSGDSFQIATTVPLLNCQVGSGGQGFSMAAGEIKTATYIDGQWFVSAPVAPLEATYADIKMLTPEHYTGQQVWCTDYDVFVRSMGTHWLAMSPIQLINDTDTLTGTVDEVIMRAYLIPRAILREKHSVRFTVRSTNTANNSSVRVRLNTINGLSGASGSHYAVTSTSALSVDKTLLCVNNSTQRTGGGSSGSANSSNTSSGVTTNINTSNDYYVLITGQLSNASDTLDLRGSSVIIQP